MREGSELARWEKWEGNIVEGSWLYSRVGDVGWLQDFVFLFLMLINGTKEQDRLKIILRGRRDGKTLLRSYASCLK